MPSLVDQFCPNVHDAAITAAAYDPDSGVIATADATGLVAVTRRGETTPGLIFHPGGPVTQAIGLIRGGSYVAVGDDNGTVGVYRCDNAQPVFVERREGARGQVRAMRGVAISPEGSKLASIAVDGLVRLWDLTRGEREIAWQGFGGVTVEFDARGDRLLCIDNQGQPKLVDLRTREGLHMDRIQMPADEAFFSRDNTYVVCSGPSGISLLRVVDGRLCASFATRGGSGIGNVVLSPDGTRAAALTRRSVHVFSLPDLQPVESLKHGAPDSEGVGFWTHKGILVAGSDGLMHGPDSQGVPPIVTATGFGEHRVAIHTDSVAVWSGDTRQVMIPVGTELATAHIDRDGQLVVARPMRGPVQIYRAKDGKRMFEGQPDTSASPNVAAGGTVVAVQLPNGGVRWWDLARNQAFELRWPRAMALSGSGTWLGVVTPKGAVRILDPGTGRDAVRPPVPLADVPVRMLAFVNRRADLLVLDDDGVLGHYDLGAAIRENRPGEGRDVLDFNVDIDRMWGITGGQYGALRLPMDDRCTILFVDLHACDVVHELNDMHPYAWVDPETGHVLEPARSGAILERGMNGEELRVLRSLPEGQWISFGPRGILNASEGAGGAMG
ncbi:MAG: WD40 repeat domain-containing protein [Alphaproteobacteria bacterium]|nr:WD40 repeat domain-containing protein [Alphaproteobacteria bacterium]